MCSSPNVFTMIRKSLLRFEERDLGIAIMLRCQLYTTDILNLTIRIAEDIGDLFIVVTCVTVCY